MQIVSIEDKHEMSKPLSENNISKCCLLKFLPRLLKVNTSVLTHTNVNEILWNWSDFENAWPGKSLLWYEQLSH